MRRIAISFIIIVCFTALVQAKDSYFVGVLGNTDNAVSQAVLNTLNLAFEEENTKNANFELKTFFVNDYDGDDAVIKEISAKPGLIAISGCFEKTHKSIIEKIKNIPLISVNSRFLGFTAPANTNTFRICPSGIDQAKELARFLITILQKSSFAVIYSLGDEDYASLADAFRETVKKNGRRVIYYRDVDGDRTDFRNILINLRDQRVEVIYFAGGLGQSINMAKQIKDLNVGATFSGIDEIFQWAFIKSAKKGAEGAIATSPVKPGYKKEIAGFLEKYEEKYKSDDSHVPFAYDEAMLIIKSLNDNKTNPEDIIKYMHEIKYKGVTGNISFNANGDRPENQICFYISRGKSFLYRQLGASEKDLLNKAK